MSNERVCIDPNRRNQVRNECHKTASMGHDGVRSTHDEESHHAIIEGTIEGRKPLGRPRNAYISQLKKIPRDNTYAGLKRLVEDREK